MASFTDPTLFTLRDGRALAYELVTAAEGKADCPIIILANSICTPYKSWNQVVPLLLDERFQVLCYDQPGHGMSGAPDGFKTTFSTLAEDVYQLVQHLQIQKVAAWIGVSMGAATGAYLAVAHPGLIDQLILCDTLSASPIVAGVADLFTPRAEAVKENGQAQLIKVVDGMLSRWITDQWRQDNQHRFNEVRDIMLTTKAEGFRTCVAALTSTSFDLQVLAPQLARTVKSVSLVVGERDANLPETMGHLRDLIQRGFDDAGKEKVPVELHVVPGAGHICYVDNCEDFVHKIKNVLSQ